MIRVLEQMKLNAQVATFLKSEKGYDPSAGTDVEIFDLTEVPTTSWDRDLVTVLKECVTTGEIAEPYFCGFEPRRLRSYPLWDDPVFETISRQISDFTTNSHGVV